MENKTEHQPSSLQIIQDGALALVRSQQFPAIVLISIGTLISFWSLFRILPELWSDSDGYYSHGFLVPLIVGYIIYANKEHFENLEIKANWFAIIPLLATLYVLKASHVAKTTHITAILLIVAILSSICLVAGFKWLKALFLPTLYILFALPLWGPVIRMYTGTLQDVSTKSSFELLRLIGFDPYFLNKTTIMLNNFTLNVGEACSGLKLLIAVSAFTIFFVLISKLKWWANVVMLSLIVPLCLFINGLRISLIGVVGNRWGAEAGMQFHDYSGYITLIICFFILFKVARLLGWTD